MEKYTYLVIGGGIAGGKACDGIYHIDKQGSIALVTAEPHYPYQRPPLSKGFLYGKEGLEKVYLHVEQQYREKKVHIITGHAVASLNPAAHQVTLDDGREIGYEKLLLATGGSALRLSIPGSDLENVFTLRTIEDSKAIRAQSGDGKKALVLGGSFIGAEVSATLTQLGTQVVQVFPESRLLEDVVPEELSGYLLKMYQERGVRILPGTVAEKLEGEGQVQQAVLDNGETLPVDLVVMGVGIRLNTGLAQAAGLALQEKDQAVIVDEYLRTSDPDIYAAGDIAAWPDPISGKRLRIEHWDVARRQGLRAGRNMAGDDTVYQVVPYFFSDLFDLSFEVWGDVSSWDQTVQRGALQSGSFAFYYFSNNHLVGVLAVNRPDDERRPMISLVERRPVYQAVARTLQNEQAELSQLVPEDSPEEAAQEEQGPLSYQNDILPMFRQKDIDAMIDISSFDLSVYQDVKKRASSIYKRLTDGSMPCDKPWSEEKIARFKSWMDQGMQP